MIDELISDLKSDEGFVPFVYKDSLGWDTIGYGFLCDERKGVGIPAQIAEQWLVFAATKRWNDLLLDLPWLIDQPEDVQRAMANMAYQLGVSGVQKFRKMLAALEAGDRELAAVEALDSRWAGQTPQRAKRITDLLRGETWDS